MNQIIDLRPYLPQQRRRKSQPTGAMLLMALEAIVTAIIALSMLVGTVAFIMML